MARPLGNYESVQRATHRASPWLSHGGQEGRPPAGPASRKRIQERGVEMHIGEYQDQEREHGMMQQSGYAGHGGSPVRSTPRTNVPGIAEKPVTQVTSEL